MLTQLYNDGKSEMMRENTTGVALNAKSKHEQKNEPSSNYPYGNVAIDWYCQPRSVLAQLRRQNMVGR